MNRPVECIIEMTQNGKHAGWAQLYTGIEVQEADSDTSTIYIVDRANDVYPFNRYYQIDSDDLVIEDTGVYLLQVPKKNWCDVRDESEFTDPRIRLLSFAQITALGLCFDL